VQSKEHLRGEVGWVTHQDFQRQGFAYEASRAMLEFGFEKMGLHRIVAEMDTRVVGSAEVATKLGMRQEAEFCEVEFFKGEWCDMWLYAILKSEFKAQKRD
jgi:aminoglycoside 6'-N-acetyltransferase